MALRKGDRVVMPNGVGAGTVKNVRSTTVDVMADTGQYGSYYPRDLRKVSA